MPDWPVASADVESASEAVDSGFSYSPPMIVEMYQATSTVLPLMCGKRQYVFLNFFLFIIYYYLLVLLQTTFLVLTLSMSVRNTIFLVCSSY